MLTKSPSGALSPYYYKGGQIHGMHYGSYLDDMEALSKMMLEEERFVMRSPGGRRILIDLYETNLTKAMLSEMVNHIERMSSRIIKLAFAGNDKGVFRKINNLLLKSKSLDRSQLYFCNDMEDGKTWLVGE